MTMREVTGCLSIPVIVVKLVKLADSTVQERHGVVRHGAACKFHLSWKQKASTHDPYTMSSVTAPPVVVIG